MRTGIAVSPGIAVGTAYCIDEVFIRPDQKRLRDQEITGELAKYETARDRASEELSAVEIKVASQVGHDEAAIFATHRAILRDPAFTNNVRNWIIEERVTAQAALHRLLEHYRQIFSKIRDAYLKDRMNDVRDVILRLSVQLSEALDPTTHALDGPVIVVASELLPSQAVELGDLNVMGIVTQTGSETSHAAIVARSRGIPAVTGVHNVLSQVKNGDTIIVDGRHGQVIINPDAETRAAFLKLEREYFHFMDQLAENRDHDAVTADGVKIDLLANINSVMDVRATIAMGGTGVGLYRTEYLYLTHVNIPDEEEQFQEYRCIVEAIPGRTVTIRTLDIGGDKTIPYLGHTHQESNPFMGWRSIRLSFEHPVLFNTQLRAILRAASVAEENGGKVRLMFPMITTLEELQKVKRLVNKAKRQLAKENKRFGDAQVGMMLEVPAAALCIELMLKHVDFVSIGSNDLVQYLMAADRDNPKVSHLCQPMAPAVLRILNQVIHVCNSRRMPLTLCGEMAGKAREFVLLLGMGLRSFSMSPRFIPFIKELATHLTTEDAQRILKRALTLSTTSRVRNYVTEQLKKATPNFDKLDTE